MKFVKNYNLNFYSTARYSIHYHATPSYYYDPFYRPVYYPSYSPVTSFSLGYGLGAMGSHSHSYHHHTTTNNNYYGNGGGGSDGTTNNNYYGGNGDGRVNNRFDGSGPYNQTSAYERPPMVMSYEPIKSSKTTNDPDADSSEVELLNPYLIVGVDNLLMYGEILDGLDIILVIDQESDGEKPPTFEELFPEIAKELKNAPTMAPPPLMPGLPPSINGTAQIPPEMLGTLLATMFAGLGGVNGTQPGANATMPFMNGPSSPPLAPMPGNAETGPNGQQPSPEQMQGMLGLMQAFAAMANSTGQPGQQGPPPGLDLNALIALKNAESTTPNPQPDTITI